MNALVQFRGVSKNFGSEAALTDIDLADRTRRATVLIGPSGCGKSTAPASNHRFGATGRAGRSFSVIARSPFGTMNTVRHHIGYVIQDGGLFPHLSARGNLVCNRAFSANPLRKSITASSSCATSLISRKTPLTVFLSNFPAVNVSASVSCAHSCFRPSCFCSMNHSPRSIRSSAQRLQTELKSIFRELHQTAVLVTHDLAEAARLGDHIVLMKEGRIVQAGTFRDLNEMPATKFVTEFINAQRSTVLT